jgi:hypothetical protein
MCKHAGVSPKAYKGFDVGYCLEIIQVKIEGKVR